MGIFCLYGSFDLLPTHTGILYVLSKQIIKIAFFSYGLFVHLQKTEPFPQRPRLLGLNDVTADYLWPPPTLALSA